MTFLAELRYTVRALGKSPVFTLIAILSLALGIGANTAVFTMLDQVLLRLLPVRDPQQLAQLSEVGVNYGSNSGLNSLSYPKYKQISEENQVFSGMFARDSLALSVSFGGRNEVALGELVSGTYFDVLGVRPALGRLFTSHEDASRGGAPYAVLAYDYWQTRFAGNPSIIGQQILVNNHKLTVIGVAQRGFDGVEALFATKIFVPLIMAEQLTQEDHPFDNR